MSNYGPPRINLSHRIRGFGLIIPYPSGVTYCALTSAEALDRRRLEGLFVPLHNNHQPNPQEELWRIFNMTLNQEKRAELIDMLLDKFLGVKDGIVVDRDRLDEMTDAWAPVLIGYLGDQDPIFEGEGFNPTQGILVWQNCD